VTSAIVFGRPTAVPNVEVNACPVKFTLASAVVVIEPKLEDKT